MTSKASGGSSAFGTDIGAPSFIRVLGTRGTFALAAVFFFSLAYNLLMLTVPLYILQIYQRVMTSQSAETLFALTTVALFALLFSVVFDHIRKAVTQRMSHRLYVEMGDKVIQKSLSPALELPDRSRPLSDVNTIRQFMGSRDLLNMMDLPFSMVFIFVLFLISPVLGLIAVTIAGLMMLLAVVSSYTSSRKQMMAMNRLRQSEEQFNRFADSGSLVHSLCMGAEVRRNWLQSQLAFSEDIRKAGHGLTVTQGMSQSLRSTAQIIAIAAAAYLALSAKVNPGMILASSILMTRAVSPIEGVIAGRIKYLSAREAYQRVAHLLSMPEQSTLLERKPNTGKIVTEGLVYVPRGGLKRQPVVRGVSLALDPGEVVSIIGPNAAGKSVLAQLLIGAVRPTAGTVQLDGADIHSYTREALIETIGYLPQVSDILPGSIADNIARFRDPDPSEVWDVLRALELETEVGNFPEKLDTPMVVASNLLTPGQYRRLLLARALYGRPSLVVLDEPDLYLDQFAHKLIADLIKGLKERGATVVLISPGEPLLRISDRVMIMKAGMLEQADAQQGSKQAPAARQNPSEGTQPEPQIPAEVASRGADSGAWVTAPSAPGQPSKPGVRTADRTVRDAATSPPPAREANMIAPPKVVGTAQQGRVRGGAAAQPGTPPRGTANGGVPKSVPQHERAQPKPVQPLPRPVAFTPPGKPQASKKPEGDGGKTPNGRVKRG